MIRGKTKKTLVELYLGQDGAGQSPAPERRFRSRKGVALIMALMIVLIGSIIIGAMFDLVNFHSQISVDRHMVGYVNHTTLLSELQAMKGLITTQNAVKNDWKVRHVEELSEGNYPPAERTLTLDDIRFKSTAGFPWYKKGPVRSGVGVQTVEVEVFDLFFASNDIDPDELYDEDFPPPFAMAGTVSSGGEDSGATLEGEATIVGGGGSVGGGTLAGGELRRDEYGAYLVRTRLFDNNGKLLRTMEEAFVQLLPQRSGAAAP